jgi:hypothetical protein
MPSTLKLITHYNAARNEYTLFRHNLSPEEADLALRELSAKLFGLFVVDQHKFHVGDDPELCQSCRGEVEASSHVQPKPKFKTRR